MQQICCIITLAINMAIPPAYHIKIDEATIWSPMEYQEQKWKTLAVFVEPSKHHLVTELAENKQSQNGKAIVEDKLKLDLNSRLAEDWARVINKPETVERQIAFLREMGHLMEDYDRTKNQDHNGSKNKNYNKRNGENNHKRDNNHHTNDKSGDRKTGDQNQQKERTNVNDKKRKHGKSSDWKERDVELKGIPDDILKERQQPRIAKSAESPTTSGLSAGKKNQSILQPCTVDCCHSNHKTSWECT